MAEEQKRREAEIAEQKRKADLEAKEQEEKSRRLKEELLKKQ